MKIINAKEITQNPFELLDNTWGIVIAGTEDDCTGMTVSWGGVGIWWGKPAVTTYIRPQRYTKKYIDANEKFSICFLPEEMRETATYFGSVSANDGIDKIRESEVTIATEDGIPYIEGSEMVFICKKQVSGEIDPARIYDPADDAANYADKDYHTMYISEIEKVLVK